jgi:hypothetical protein
MKPDKTVQSPSLASIPGEFKENYLFLRELITCHEKNKAAKKVLQPLVHIAELQVRTGLNRRQRKILKDFLDGSQQNISEYFDAPVPPELEASIRIRKRSTWLPWEAEAIHKIEQWRADLGCITLHLTREEGPVGEKRPLTSTGR